MISCELFDRNQHLILKQWSKSENNKLDLREPNVNAMFYFIKLCFIKLRIIF